LSEYHGNDLKIEKIIGIKGLTLLTYYTRAEYWQFVIVGKDGKIWQPDEIFYTPDEAETEGKRWIRAVMR
jgi:hypothetical protein